MTTRHGLYTVNLAIRNNGIRASLATQVFPRCFGTSFSRNDWGEKMAKRMRKKGSWRTGKSLFCILFHEVEVERKKLIYIPIQGLPLLTPEQVLGSLSDQVRGLMRSQPHGLAAVVSPSRPPNDPLARNALLVSSFNTVSLEPVPFVSFNIKTPSATWDHIRESGSFTVTGLVDANAARVFSGAIDKNNGRASNERTDESWRDWIGGFGEVKQEFGGTWWLHCKLRPTETSRVGDHKIVVGIILTAGGKSSSNKREQKSEGEGLMYVNGEYHRIGKAVEDQKKPEDST